MTTLQYVYRVDDVVKVTDGDTYWLRLDVGFRQSALVNVRLAGYDTPEVNSGSATEKAAGKRATEAALLWLSGHLLGDAPVWIRTEKDPDSFGRWVGTIWTDEAGTLGGYLLDVGLASLWPTRWREQYETTIDTDRENTE